MSSSVLREYQETPVVELLTPYAGPPTVIIDTDPGIDDAMALLLAFAAHKRKEISIIGITIVIGNNGDQELLARNACFLLEVAGLSSEIPIYKGCSDPMTTPYHGHSGILVHGDNGFGGVPLPFEPSLAPIVRDTSAIDFIRSAVTARPGEVTLVTLGPLSNIGTLLATSPGGFPASVRRVVMMGGDTRGVGNKAPAAEANVHNDPEAAKLVFGMFSDIVMAGLNVTQHVELSESFRLKMRDCGEVGAFLYAITTHYVTLLTSWLVGKIVVHDSTAVMALLHPEIFSGSRVCVDVETTGDITRGATIADWAGHWEREPQTLVLKSVDESAFHRIYLDYLSDFAAVKLVKP